jgi:predicted dinucleotide-binding enzyme
VLALGARAVSTAQAVEDVDVVILSIPLNRIPTIAPLIANLPAETVVIDTSNYYPHRDDKIDAIEAGQVESLWVAQQLGRSPRRGTRSGLAPSPPWASLLEALTV